MFLRTPKTKLIGELHSLAHSQSLTISLCRQIAVLLRQQQEAIQLSIEKGTLSQVGVKKPSFIKSAQKQQCTNHYKKTSQI